MGLHTDFEAATRIDRRSALYLLCWVADMFRIARVIGIELDEASLRA